jgi:membrane-associated protease RseP (regulator of RpoE activity)
MDRLVIWKVIPRSPAFYAGLRPGDSIVTFGGQSVASPTAFAQLVQRTDAGPVSIQVNRNGQVRTVNADFPNMETGSVHTTFRQNLDSGAAVQPNLNSSTDVQGNAGVNAQDGTVRGNVNASGQVESYPQRTYNNYNYRGNSGRRGLFRRR